MTLVETQARRHEKMYSDYHRKLLGTHYTPEAVVEYIVNRSLQPYLEKPNLLPSIRILDPACGSGLFLLKAFDVLADHWQKSFGSFTYKDAQHLIENSLFGIDIDERAVNATRKYLLQKACLSESDAIAIDANIVVGDALILRPPAQVGIDEKSVKEKPFVEHFTKHSFDCILGNPPYVRIQNMPLQRRELYTSSYSTAAGRFDASGLFLELSEYLLKDNGRLGFIVTNKLLSTSGAKKLRTFLLGQFAIEEIVDLSDTKLFDAAILPLIIIARRSREQNTRITYSSITEQRSNKKDIYQTKNLLNFLGHCEIPFDANVKVDKRVFRVQRFDTAPPSVKANVWAFHNEHENRLLSKLKSNSCCTLRDLCENISVGLKTTADSVFIKPMTDEFIVKQGLENELIFPLLESHNVHRWRCSWDEKTDLHVLYPHKEMNGKVIPVDLEAYPRAKRYLESRRDQLESRTYVMESGRQWYEIWVHQSPSHFSQKKIITPDISSQNRFAIDNKGFYVNGTCFYLILKDNSDISYYSILGLLNSKVMEYFHKATSSNYLYAKRFRYWSSYLKCYPIAKRLFNSPDLIASIVRNVNCLINTVDDADRIEFEKENDRLCYQLYDLTLDEIKGIEDILSNY